MAQHLSTITRKGQITIPAEFRRALALREGDEISLLLEDGQMRLIPTGSVTARTAGLLKGDEPPLSVEEMREAAEKAITETAVEPWSADSVVARTAGIFKSDRPILTREEERAAFERLVAEEVDGRGDH